jgi:hypothetical protein
VHAVIQIYPNTIMNLLIKYPTRQRPELFLKTLSEYIRKAADENQYLISIDKDDASMTAEVIEQAKSLHSNIKFFAGDGINKIEACNRDIEKAADWDIVLLVSDDMQPVVAGWDKRIKQDMLKHFPDTDGCLWYHDGAQQEICTLSCVGRKYYDRFNYLYHSSYKSFYCDNEFTEVATRDGKMAFIPHMIIKHQHPSWGGGVKNDLLYMRNDKYWGDDETNYKKRKANGFNDCC